MYTTIKQYYMIMIFYNFSPAPKKPKNNTNTNQKLQQAVTQAIRQNIEEEMRAKAVSDGRSFKTKST